LISGRLPKRCGIALRRGNATTLRAGARRARGIGFFVRLLQHLHWIHVR